MEETKVSPIKVSGAYNKVMEIARQNGFSQDVFFFGTGWKMIDHPQYMNEWAVYPDYQFPRNIPQFAYDRVKLLQDAGIQIVGVVILDDPTEHPIPPRLLAPAPGKPHPKYNVPQINLPEIKWRYVFETTAKILLGIVATVVAVVVGAVVLAVIAALAVVAGFAIITLGALATILVNDPILCIIEFFWEFNRDCRMGRLIFSLLRLFLGTTSQVVVLVLRWGVLLLRFFVPRLLQVLWFIIRLMFLSVASILIGVPTTIRRTRTDWMKRAIAAGLPLNRRMDVGQNTSIFNTLHLP